MGLELEVGSVSSYSAVPSTMTAPCRYFAIVKTQPLQRCPLVPHVVKGE